MERKAPSHTINSCRRYKVLSSSDAAKRVVDHAAAFSVDAVFQLASDTPCQYATAYVNRVLGGLKKRLRCQRSRLQIQRANFK
jgi:hypothetical protein